MAVCPCVRTRVCACESKSSLPERTPWARAEQRGLGYKEHGQPPSLSASANPITTSSASLLRSGRDTKADAFVLDGLKSFLAWRAGFADRTRSKVTF